MIMKSFYLFLFVILLSCAQKKKAVFIEPEEQYSEPYDVDTRNLIRERILNPKKKVLMSEAIFEELNDLVRLDDWKGLKSLLVLNNYNLDMASGRFGTLLNNAVYYKSISSLKVLLRFGADPNYVWGGNWTALHTGVNRFSG